VLFTSMAPDSDTAVCGVLSGVGGGLAGIWGCVAHSTKLLPYF